MSDTGIFIVGAIISLIVFFAFGGLLWAAVLDGRAQSVPDDLHASPKGDAPRTPGRT